jgi:hypothetical protein
MQEKTFGLILRLAGWSMAAVAGVLLFIGCDSGGDDSGGASGDATVIGNVASFSAGGTAYLFERDARRGFAVRLLAGLADILVPAAEAAAGGVTVSVSGTGLSDVTDAGGYFAISGVPPGNQEFVFTQGAYSGILVVDVPPSSTIELRNVRVNDQAVTVDDLLVQVSETVTAPSGGGDDGGGSAGEGSSSSDDDDSGEDDGSGDDKSQEGEDDEGEDD